MTVGFFGITYSLSIIDLSNNHLEGGLPAELFTLVGLRYLNLSHNQLSGPIPSAFSSMILLVQLDVSNNNFSGSIPSTLASLDKLDYVDFSSNKLVGRIPFGSRYSSASYLGNPGLCGEILGVSCSTPLSPSPINEVLIPSSSPSTEAFLLWIGFGIGCSISFLITMGLFLCTDRGLHFILGILSHLSTLLNMAFSIHLVRIELSRKVNFTHVACFCWLVGSLAKTRSTLYCIVCAHSAVYHCLHKLWK